MADAQARQQLEVLVSSLRHYQKELEDAEREGLTFVAESCRRELQQRHDVIRRHCSAIGLAVPHEVLQLSRGANTHADTKLREQLAKLFDYRHDLEAAEIRGDRVVAEMARRMIRTQCVIIRRYCASTGLPRPPDVPEED